MENETLEKISLGGSAEENGISQGAHPAETRWRTQLEQLKSIEEGLFTKTWAS